VITNNMKARLGLHNMESFPLIHINTKERVHRQTSRYNPSWASSLHRRPDGFGSVAKSAVQIAAKNSNTVLFILNLAHQLYTIAIAIMRTRSATAPPSPRARGEQDAKEEEEDDMPLARSLQHRRASQTLHGVSGGRSST
jgi:hypothetical protein